MINISENISNMLGLPARRIDARVELYYCSTLQNDDYNRILLDTYTNEDALQEFKVERMADDGKFFGFGVCQKLTVKLRDKDRQINIEKGQVLEVSYGVEDSYTYPCPLFQVEEVSRDEANNNLTITAYDFLYKAGEHRVDELGSIAPYTIRSFVMQCASILNLPVKFTTDEPAFDLSFPNGANFDGSETLREALNAVADATQTIFFVDWDWRLTFKRIDTTNPVIHVDKTKYFELKNKSDRTLTTLWHVTELGDNLRATTGAPGVEQFIRNNPFWDMREDVDTLLTEALDKVAGMTISQFDISWRGNFALEIGDRFSIEAKDGSILYGHVLNDTLIYNGGLREQTFWNYTEHNAETASNPVNLGEALKQTFAKVDKANKEITLFVSETTKSLDDMSETIEEKAAEIKMTTDAITQRVEATEKSISDTNEYISEKIAEINLTTDGITQRVEQTEKTVGETSTQVGELEVRADGIAAEVSSTKETLGSEIDDANSTIEDLKKSLGESVDNINESLVTLSTQVSASMSSEEIRFAIETALSDGVNSVSTTTGYTFDNEGLTIAKTGSEMTTQITEDGMTVYRGAEGVLVANNEGVHAEDLRATTYLIIGDRSRFENFERNGSIRTGCFWIG